MRKAKTQQKIPVFGYQKYFFLLAAVLTSQQSFAALPQAEEILAKADDVRNPSESYNMKVSVQSGKQDGDRSEFDVSIQGNQKTLIKTLAPTRDRGRNLLMLQEEMWA